VIDSKKFYFTLRQTKHTSSSKESSPRNVIKFSYNLQIKTSGE
jgi:hypothetical protein